MSFAVWRSTTHITLARSLRCDSGSAHGRPRQRRASRRTESIIGEIMLSAFAGQLTLWQTGRPRGLRGTAHVSARVSRPHASDVPSEAAMRRALALPAVLALALSFSIAGAAGPKPGSAAAPPKPGSTAAAPEKKDKKDPFKGLEFRNIGPAMTSGRVIDIAIHPNDHDIWYVAVGSGGLWKTTNAGTIWQPVFEKEASYSGWLGSMVTQTTEYEASFSNTGCQMVPAFVVFQRPPLPTPTITTSGTWRWGGWRCRSRDP